MPYPPLVTYAAEDEYRKHFERVYCRGPVITFDGIPVRFRKQDFNHAFYESIQQNDDTFSIKRAQRIDWIKTALEDSASERYVGWDKKRKRFDRSRRVALVMGNYVVVIAISRKGKGRFITTFVADSEKTLKQIRNSLKWT